MLGAKKVTVLLERVEKKLDELLLNQGEVGRLSDQNKELFDRLMSIDWEKFAYLREDKDKSPSDRSQYIYGAESDETNIGEILSDEDIGN